MRGERDERNERRRQALTSRTGGRCDRAHECFETSECTMHNAECGRAWAGRLRFPLPSLAPADRDIRPSDRGDWSIACTISPLIISHHQYTMSVTLRSAVRCNATRAVMPRRTFSKVQTARVARPEALKSEFTGSSMMKSLAASFAGTWTAVAPPMVGFRGISLHVPGRHVAAVRRVVRAAWWAVCSDYGHWWLRRRCIVRNPLARPGIPSSFSPPLCRSPSFLAWYRT